jgi:hypothetical protein
MYVTERQDTIQFVTIDPPAQNYKRSSFMGTYPILRRLYYLSDTLQSSYAHITLLTV